MALNWTMSENGSPVTMPLPNEKFISEEHNIEITLNIPDAPPQGGSMAGGSGGAGRTMKAVGTVWVSNQRFIFVASRPGQKPCIESLSVPHHLIVSTKFEQPYFSANYLNLDIFPVPEGGLTPGTRAEVRFKDRGMFGWVEMLSRTREAAIVKRREDNLGEPDALPLYVPPPRDSLPQEGAGAGEERGGETAGSESIGDDRPPAYF